MKGTDLLQAMAYVGHDLVDEAEQRRFPKPLWRRWAGLAACLTVLTGLGLGTALLLRASPQVSPAPAPAQTENPASLPAEPENPTEAEDTPEEAYTPRELEARFIALVYQNYIYYLQSPLTPAGDWSDWEEENLAVLGVIEDGQPLEGAACYYSKKYVVWSHDGIPLEMYLKYHNKCYYAATHGERADRTAAYTYEEARSMSDETLYYVFAYWIEFLSQDASLTYRNGQSPSPLAQLSLFGGLVQMEDQAGFISRYTRADRWLPLDWDMSLEQCQWEFYVPAADIQNLLDVYFDGCKFDPRELDCYDPEQDTLHLDWLCRPYGTKTAPSDLDGQTGRFTALHSCQWDDDSRTVQIQIELWENDYEALPTTEDGIPYDVTTTKTGEKIYTIQFTEAGPRYLGIEQTG